MYMRTCPAEYLTAIYRGVQLNAGLSWNKDVSIFDFGIIHNAAMVDEIGNEALNLSGSVH